MKEGIEFTSVILSLVKRLDRLENQLEDVSREHAQPTQFVSADQLDELTTKVEQNMTRKLRQRMGERP